MFIKSLFKGGVEVPHCKNTTQMETVKMSIPEEVVIPMLQHIGAPCRPVVKEGQTVKVGQVIGVSDSFVSAPVHSSVSGIVKDISSMLYSNGSNVATVVIKTDGKQEVHEDVKPPSYNSKEELLAAIRDSGLVGLGGAGFPAHIKLNPPKDKIVDTLIINAAECEPYITSDYREIMENSAGIIEGIGVISKLLNANKVVIGVEDNKPDAINLLRNLTSGKKEITVKALKTRYPQGAEKMLIYSLTGLTVPSGKLPADVGVVVMNVTSVAFLAEYLKTGMPLIKKRITVDGSAVNKPANLEVPIGTKLSDVFEFCGGFKKEPHKIIMGGPMMGIALFSLDMPVLKQTNALIAFDEDLAKLPSESACIRCGRCAMTCPMNLLPLKLNNAALREDLEALSKFHVMDCIECGSCTYGCPAKIHLVQSIRLGKAQVKKASQKNKAG